jgi:galactokinase/mevalonate kinase-like predicted kinase
MTQIDQLKEEIERVSERRGELWQSLSWGHDATVSAELKRLDETLNALWDEHRALRARIRFGERERIIKRARTEERLMRAA